jgi:hypothetical protein
MTRNTVRLSPQAEAVKATQTKPAYAGLVPIASPFTVKAILTEPYWDDSYSTNECG